MPHLLEGRGPGREDRARITVSPIFLMDSFLLQLCCHLPLLLAPAAELLVYFPILRGHRVP
jgi:hypothetical protein